MAHITRSITIGCSPERVFDVLSDIDRLPEFSEMTVSVRGPGRPLERGDRFEQVVRILNTELETEWEVVEVERPRRLRVEGRSASNGRATLTHTVRPVDGGTELEFDVDYDLPLGVLGDVVDALFVERRNEEEAETILAGLRSICESAPTG